MRQVSETTGLRCTPARKVLPRDAAWDAAPRRATRATGAQVATSRRFSSLWNDASRCGTAATGAAVALLLTLACAAPREAPPPHVVTAPAPARDGETDCAWYGDRGGDVLYFGESSFWSALRAKGDPAAD